MKLAIISHPDCLKHEMLPDHSESPERIRTIATFLKHPAIKKNIDNLEANKISLEDLYAVHTKDYVHDLFH